MIFLSTFICFTVVNWLYGSHWLTSIYFQVHQNFPISPYFPGKNTGQSYISSLCSLLASQNLLHILGFEDYVIFYLLVPSNVYFLPSSSDSQVPAPAAKSLQLCPTLCDLMDCSLPGSSVHEIFQARVLEWGAIAFSILGRREAIFDLSHFVS